jgi:hypothetical protein
MEVKVRIENFLAMDASELAEKKLRGVRIHSSSISGVTLDILIYTDTDARHWCHALRPASSRKLTKPCHITAHLTPLHT